MSEALSIPDWRPVTIYEPIPVRIKLHESKISVEPSCTLL